MGPDGTRNHICCAGEDQQQFTRPTVRKYEIVVYLENLMIYISTQSGTHSRHSDKNCYCCGFITETLARKKFASDFEFRFGYQVILTVVSFSFSRRMAVDSCDKYNRNRFIIELQTGFPKLDKINFVVYNVTKKFTDI
jgi:hypothetical protein